jgi:hypothetical protein
MPDGCIDAQGPSRPIAYEGIFRSGKKCDIISINMSDEHLLQTGRRLLAVRHPRSLLS